MGLTKSSTGHGAVSGGLRVQKQSDGDIIVALAGNPNVGKSTVFNALTGLRQHTGNWPGKTVSCSQGRFEAGGRGYIMVDIPGCYSLMARSAEEEVARDFICFEQPDIVVVVCDATCLERNMNLVMQTLEITRDVVVCVNLMDEAAKKHITVDTAELSTFLGVPVVPISARSGDGLPALISAIGGPRTGMARAVKYPEYIEKCVERLLPCVTKVCGDINARWLALRLLDGDDALFSSVACHFGRDIREIPEISELLRGFRATLAPIFGQKLRDDIIGAILHTSESLCVSTVTFHDAKYGERDRAIDRVLTGRVTGFPMMLALLVLVFWLTISGANYPSEVLSSLLFRFGDLLSGFFASFGMDSFINSMLIDGVYRVLAWVVSVMLPPMAIFFPLFTLLEDVGYLPRVAFNLDRCFRKCRACGKQALTMCMGFGCNAAGVVGCRIIDSPRERLIAIITNAFVPCNGRFAPPHKWQV